MLEINNTTKQKINLKTASEIVERFLHVYRKIGWTVSLAIVGDAKIKKINQQYRGINKATDVLSFDSGSSSVGSKKTAASDKYLGEIIINIQEAARVGKYQELWREIGQLTKPRRDDIFYFLLVHGLLHLIGYNDETEKERLVMLTKGKKFLEIA